MLLHCLSGLSACSQISQSWYSPWHTNAASPRLAETKILTFSILMWPRQQKATSQPADKPQCLFLSPKPFCLPLKEQRLPRTGQAAALRARHCSPPSVYHHSFPPHRPVCAWTPAWELLGARQGTASSRASASLPRPPFACQAPSRAVQEPFCPSGTATGPHQDYMTLWERTKPREQPYATGVLYGPWASSPSSSPRQDWPWLFPFLSFLGVSGQATVYSMRWGDPSADTVSWEGTSCIAHSAISDQPGQFKSWHYCTSCQNKIIQLNSFFFFFSPALYIKVSFHASR